MLVYMQTRQIHKQYIYTYILKHLPVGTFTQSDSSVLSCDGTLTNCGAGGGLEAFVLSSLPGKIRMYTLSK